MDRFFTFAFQPKLAGAFRLYCHTEGFVLKNGVFCAEKENAVLSFRTFFNGISIAKIRQYTDIESLSFSFELDGELEAALYADDKRILKKRLSGGGSVSVLTEELPAGADILYPKLLEAAKGSKVKKITVSAESRSARAINCACIICTFRRENTVKKTVRYLLEHCNACRDFSVKMIVADNGQTLSAHDFGKEVLLLSGRNSGGSGGFTAGMKKAREIGGFTHFILMDDDAEIDFLSLQKGLNFLKFLKPEFRELSLSGSMLYLDKPCIQFESGGYFGTDGKQRGYGHFLNLEEPGNLAQNEAERQINYGGFWLMCMPFSHIQNKSYPLPFFMKYDDVEYALRCGLRILTLNGFSVWHQKFEAKYNSVTEYYNIRNYLHLCSVHCTDFDRKKAERAVWKRLIHKLCRQQYGMAEAVIFGYRDYQKGMDFLKNLDAEENHRKICRLNEELLSYEEIQKRFGFRPRDGWHYPAPKGKAAVFALLPKRVVFTDLLEDRAVQYWSAGYAVHCDFASNRGYVTKRDYRKFWKLIKELKIQIRRSL